MQSQRFIMTKKDEPIEYDDGELFPPHAAVDDINAATAPKSNAPATTSEAEKTPEHQHPDGPFKRLMNENFLQYASYVIRDRAIPDIEDGLKPVQRRIMFSLHENDDGKFIKVANIVGYCMQFHPHGDASIADALVTLTNKRYLIEGQGNFGNLLTGDPSAASRYIECRLTQLARNELFNDDLSEFIPTYDGRKKEPVTLPSKLPLLLMLGAEGIAVGLSTRILPHNFPELLEAQIAILQKKKFTILPDFQHGGVMDTSEYDDGNGRVKVRAIMETKDDSTLIIREIPFGSTTETLISSVEDAARKKKIKIRSINDYTAERIEIEIKLAQDADIKQSIEALFAFTQCEMSINSHLILIRNNRPVEMTVSEILKYNTEGLTHILNQELLLEKQRLLDELHRKTLVQIFVEHRIYKRIEECKTYELVQQAVLDGVNEHRDKLRRDVTAQDVEMLLEVKIKRISLFDINKNRQETDKILLDLDKVEKNLASLVPYAIRYLKALHKQYAPEYPRLTRIDTFSEIEVKKLTEKQLTFRLDREKGYLGYEIEGEELFTCSSNDKIIIVWGDGRYKALNPPEKLFVDENMVYAAPFDRDHNMLAVYRDEAVTYMKRFSFGGVILNRDYSCIPDRAELLLFDAADPNELYVKYAKEKRQRINQQIFHPERIAVKGVKAKGLQMTVKKIKTITTKKPRNWDNEEAGPRGAVMDFL